jgi:hypothetical protein
MGMFFSALFTVLYGSIRAGWFEKEVKKNPELKDGTTNYAQLTKYSNTIVGLESSNIIPNCRKCIVNTVILFYGILVLCTIIRNMRVRSVWNILCF